MATPEPEVKMEDVSDPQSLLGKRKRDDDTGAEGPDQADTDSRHDEQRLFIPDEADISLRPQDGEGVDDSGDEGNEDDDNDGSDLDSDDEDEALKDDDSETEEQIHMEADEEWPKCAIYDGAVEGIKQTIMSIPQEVTDLMSNHDENVKQVRNLLQAAHGTARLPDTKKPRIALVGGAGVGKSSSFNAITDIPNLAKSLAGGQSCTCVPYAFSGAFQGQTKKYGAMVRYLDKSGIRKLLAEYLTDYNTYEFEADDDWDQETRQQFHKRAMNALNTLHVLFRDLPEFATREAMKTYLKKNYDEHAAEALNLMMESCEKKLNGKEISEGAAVERCQAANRRELREATEPFTSSRSNSTEPALWPLVQQISIGVRGSRVLDKVTIIDLPGISDSNTTRINLVREYVKSCSYIWVVTPIGRAIDDGLTFNMVHRYGKLFRGRIAVICTHSDADIDTKLARELKDEGLDMDRYYDLSEQLKAKAKQIQSVNKQIKKQNKVRRQTNRLLLDTKAKELELKTLRRDQECLKLLRYEHLVQARNDHVTQQLRQHLDDHIPEGCSLPVFCISNMHYAAIKANKSLKGLRLTPEGTGVPNLRAHALKLAAPGLFRTLDQYINTDIAVFLKNARLWTKVTQVEKRAELLQLAKAPLNKLAGYIDSRRKAFAQELKDSFTTILKREFSRIRDTAAKALNSKRRKHPSTIRAFIRKDGNHSTQLCPKECWNEQFSKGSTDIVNELWDVFECSKAKMSAQLLDKVVRDMQAIIPNISNEHPLSTSHLPIDRLEELVEAQTTAIANIFDNDEANYEQDLRNIHMDATQDSQRNYFSKTIQSVYDECNGDSGAGVIKRSLDRIETHLLQERSSSPFTKISSSVSKALLRNDEKHFNNQIQKQVAAVLNSVYDSFDQLVDETVEDPRETRSRVALQKALPKLEADFHTAQDALAALKGRYEC